MKQTLGGLIVGLLLALFMGGQSVSANTNNFTFSSFTADYYLGADSEGRSTLKTVERLTAEFPQINQNHGIERAIPKSYDGHTTSLKVQSVTDETGKALPFTTYDSNDNLVLRIGDKDAYVQGAKTYVLTYTQRDVTKTYSDTQRNEFYWDTNGLFWPQSFGVVEARVHVADSLLPTLTTDLACYKGREGSSERCDITRSGNVVSAKVTDLRAYENMTIALGFTLGTFRGYEPSLWDRIFSVWIALVVVSSIIGFIAIFWLSYRYSKVNNRTRELDPVAPEYTAPKQVSILTSSQIGDGTKADTTAQLIDLAVRHYITITQTKEKSLWQQAEYELTIVKDVSTLLAEEQDFVRTLFGDTKVGTTLATKTLKNNYTMASTLRQNTQALTKRIKGEYEYRHKDDAASGWFKRTGIIMGIISVALVSPLLFIAAIVAVACGYTLRPLTDKGLDLRRYLAGLKLYIEAAEKDRIAMLQSPEAVAKTGVSVKGDDSKKLLKLYERTLPYAVLFGQEKEWNKQLGTLYEEVGSSPTWYAGHSAFNAAVFTSAMNDFSGSMNSYGASTSSSSGGSSGGGSSGGGGGGGGGGGW